MQSKGASWSRHVAEPHEKHVAFLTSQLLHPAAHVGWKRHLVHCSDCLTHVPALHARPATEDEQAASRAYHA